MMTPVPENFAVKIEGIVLRQYYDTRHPYIAGTSFMTATPIFERNLRKGVRRVNRVYISALGPSLKLGEGSTAGEPDDKGTASVDRRRAPYGFR
jgi:hypothetical protein